MELPMSCAGGSSNAAWAHLLTLEQTLRWYSYFGATQASGSNPNEVITPAAVIVLVVCALFGMN